MSGSEHSEGAEDIEQEVEEEGELGEEDNQELEEDGKEMRKRRRDNLAKKVAQCILASCTKRGYCRDVDVSELFTDHKERELREKVLKRVQKNFLHVFGMKLKRDEELRRYYIYNNLFGNTVREICESLDRRSGNFSSSYVNDDDDENSCSSNEEMQRTIDGADNNLNLENKDFKRWLLTSTLMFIFMTKRHAGNDGLKEKGVDWAVIKNFLESMFDTFKTERLTTKQYSELFGPAKSAEFISQGWLRSELHFDQATGVEDIFYHWGSRAETVISKKEMLEEFCRIYGGTPADWPNHCKYSGIRL